MRLLRALCEPCVRLAHVRGSYCKWWDDTWERGLVMCPHAKTNPTFQGRDAPPEGCPYAAEQVVLQDVVRRTRRN